MNRREFAQSALATAAVGSIAMAETDKSESASVAGFINFAVLYPTAMHYPSIIGLINVLICTPQASAVLAEYTKHDRLEKGDEWGISWFHGKHVTHVGSDAEAIAYYRQLDQWNDWTPCIVRLPQVGEVDFEAIAVHCEEHSVYRQKCEQCRNLFDIDLPRTD